MWPACKRRWPSCLTPRPAARRWAGGARSSRSRNDPASAAVARELYAAARARGAHFIDAPVSGGQAGAENGVLTVMCGGAAEAYARAVFPSLDAVNANREAVVGGWDAVVGANVVE